MPIAIPVYSEQPMTADAYKIIQAVLEEYPPNTFDFVEVDPGSMVVGIRVLVFGTIKDPNTSIDMPVFTYSLAQIVTKANAVSVLKASLNQFYLWQKVHPKKLVLGPLDRMDFDKPIAVDIETSGNLGNVHTPEEVKILSISFYQEGRWACWYGFTGLSSYESELLSKIKYPIWHNGKFDIRVIEAQTGIRMPNYFDTMLAHHVLNQAAGDHKLKNLARRYLGAPEWEADLKQWTVGGAYYENIPTQKLIEYNCWDVYWTYELWKYLEPQILADEQASAVFMLEMAAADMLLDVEQFGFAVDVPAAEQLELDLTAEVGSLRNKLRIITSNPNYNPGSWQQTKAYVQGAFSVVLPSTDEDAMIALKKNYTASATFVDTLLAYRKAKKSLSTYVVGLLNRQRDGRVHTTFLVHGTSTGRLSSSGPNIQNIPRDKKYRGLYIG